MLLALLIFSLLLLVLLGFYVFVAAPRSRPHVTFAIFIACLVLWTIKDIVFWGFDAGNAGAGWWVGASFILALMMQYSLVIFAWVFPENHPLPVKRAAMILAPAAVLIPAVAAGFLWRKVGFIGTKFSVELTPLAYFYVAYVYGLFVYGFGLLIVKYRSYRGTQRGQQLGAIIWALVVTGILKTVANIALPLFGMYSLVPIGSVFVLPGAIIYAYAISNFKLFSFQSALDQFRLVPIAFKVALTIAGVAILSFVLLQIPIVWWSFRDSSGPEAWRRYLVFSVITALFPNLLLVALIVRSISRPVRQITVAAVQVAAGEYGAQVELRSNDEIGLLAVSFNEMSTKMAADIDQLRRLNEQLIRTEKLAAAGTLAAGVAHEVNNPLASISSLVQILQSKAGTDEETGEMLRLISTQITRISQVTRDMMEFARARPAQRSIQALRPIVEAAVRLATFDKAFQRLAITTDFDAQAPPVDVDADQIQQVVLNLLLNARDAMPDGGKLNITTNFDSPTDELTLAIADSGAGIAADDLSQIFDPFFTTKGAGQGTGLGLAVCYGIVTAHGGRIVATSNHGGGTIMRIILPIASETKERD